MSAILISSRNIFEILLLTCIGLALCSNSLYSQEIIVDPNETGADDVLLYVPDLFIDIPLPDPIPVPVYDTGVNELKIGNTSEGKLLISGGASVTTPLAIIGNESTSNGVLDVNGTNSNFATESLFVGKSGNGILNVSDGGTLESSFHLLVAQDPDSSGFVSVSGMGTVVDSGLTIVLGEAMSGPAELTVSNAGTVFNNHIIDINRPTVGDAVLTVTGQNSRLAASGSSMHLEDTFQVLDGAVAELEELASASFDEALILVEGEDSVLMVGGSLLVGSQYLENLDARLLISNGARVDVNRVFVGRTLANFDNGLIIVNGDATLHIENFINAMPDSVQFNGGTLSFSGDRVYAAGLAGSGFESILVDRDGTLTNNETIRVEGNFTAQSPILILDATLSAGSVTGMQNIDLIRGRLEFTDMDLEISGSSDSGSMYSLDEDQELFVTREIVVATDGFLELNGGLIETNSLINEGQIQVDGDNVEIFGDLIQSGDILFDGGSYSLLVGDMQLESDATSTVGISSPISGPGQMDVIGQLQLGGALQVDLQYGFEPQASAHFIVMAASQVVGQFDNVEPGERLNTDNGSFLVDYGPTSPFGSSAVVVSDYQAGGLIGDINGDGAVNLLDVSPFIEVLASGSYNSQADINLDGVVNLLDVQPFVDLLTS